MADTILTVLIAAFWTWLLYGGRSQFDGKGWLYGLFGIEINLNKPENLVYTFFVMLGVHSNIFLEVLILILLGSHIIGKPIRPVELINKLVAMIKK